MKRHTMILAAMPLTVGLLAGCGGTDSGSSDFCALAKGNVSALSSIASGSQGFEGLRKDLDKLVDAAPSEIKGDVKQLADMVTGLAQAFKDAGVGDEDLKALQSGDSSVMKDIDEAKFAAAMEKMASSFDEDAVDDAYKNIATYSEDECGVSLEPLE